MCEVIRNVVAVNDYVVEVYEYKFSFHMYYDDVSCSLEQAGCIIESECHVFGAVETLVRDERRFSRSPGAIEI